MAGDSRLANDHFFQETLFVVAGPTMPTVTIHRFGVPTMPTVTAENPEVVRYIFLCCCTIHRWEVVYVALVMAVATAVKGPTMPNLSYLARRFPTTGDTNHHVKTAVAVSLTPFLSVTASVYCNDI
jgi:hypothetical protein